MMKRLVVCAALALAFAAPKAEAAFLDGSIAYAYVGATLLPGPGTGFGDNTTVTSNGGLDNVGNPTTGDFLTANGAAQTSTAAPIANLTYGSTGYVGGAVPNFVSFVGALDGFTYTFSITNYTTLSVAPATGNPSSATILTGFGIWTTNNPLYSPTSGGFTFSGTSVDGTTYQAGGTLNAFATATGGEVPEPASMMLLGSGLVGIASAARKRRKAKQAQS